MGRLVLSRRRGEQIVLQDKSDPDKEIVLEVVGIGREQARISIEAGGRYDIKRREPQQGGTVEPQ